MARKPQRKKITAHTNPKKAAAKRVAHQELHFLRILKQGRKIYEMRVEVESLHGEALRAYLIREFGAGKQGEQFRRFSAADLAGFRQMLIDGCNQWLRDAGKGMK